jgi:tetratricopeptide (TPR) repeat protein
LTSQTILGHNQETYQELRLALQLNLRRQLLIAVCDDPALQTQLAQRLENNFAPLPETVAVAPEVRARQLTLVTLALSSDRPDLVREVVLWLKQQQRDRGRLPARPIFQIVGIDQLTRQSPTVQNRFLAALGRVDALLTQLDCRLVVWLPRPWLSKIRQSAPGFWRSRSGLFEFVGDPSPQPSGAPVPAPAPGAAPAPPAAPDLWHVLQDDLSSFEQPEPEPAAPEPAAPEPVKPEPAVPEPAAAEAPGDEPRPSAIDLPTPLGAGPAAAIAPSPLLTLETAPPATVALPMEALSVEALLAPQAAAPPVLSDPAALASSSTSESLQLPPELAQEADLASLWRYIQGLIEQQAGPLTLARAYLALGQVGRDRLVSAPPTDSLLAFTIAVYRQALMGLAEGSADWCDALNDLASLYWLQGQQSTTTDPAPWLRRSVHTYETALQGGPATIDPDTLARIYSNLATVYGLLANFEDPAPCLEQAASAYQKALKYSPAASGDYATLQNSLGAVYWRLAQHDRPPHYLPLAIAAYTEALAHCTTADPLEQAMVQNNLGIAYWSLAQHQQPMVLLERAIAAYQAALVHRTPQANPAGCAATANNLGTAYWDLAQQPAVTGDRRLTTLAQAIAAYETALTAAQAALQELPPAALGFDLWATCHSAGVVHDQIAQALPSTEADQRQRHLALALQHYLFAYEGWRDSPTQLAVLTTALVYNLHLHFEFFGSSAQQTVLSKLPGELLPDILRQL